jgi:uncharacterized protein YndB with AHSA1/START domain
MSDEKKQTSELESFNISRSFDAPRALVYEAWTDAKHLVNWFGPSGCTLKVEKLDLKPGGFCLFCMSLPNGSEMWGKWSFCEILKPQKLVWVHSFSNKEGGNTRHPFDPNWPMELLTTVTFVEENKKTIVNIEWVPVNPNSDEIKAFKNGAKGAAYGWTGTLNQLDAYITKIK